MSSPRELFEDYVADFTEESSLKHVQTLLLFLGLSLEKMAALDRETTAELIHLIQQKVTGAIELPEYIDRFTKLTARLDFFYIPEIQSVIVH